MAKDPIEELKEHPITKLFKPFAPDQVQWRPSKVSDDRTQTLALAYVDARAVMDRLDEAVGPAGWQDRYDVLPGQVVVCTLTVWFDNDNITRQDVGYPNGKSDEEPLKSAFSDALKRTAVKFGIGRELYDIEPMWLPYDERTKKITATPQYVAGKGWVAPQAPVLQAASATGHAPDKHLASEAMKRKVFAAFTERGKRDQLKAASLAVLGKESSTTWTPEDVDKLLAFLEQDMAA